MKLTDLINAIPLTVVCGSADGVEADCVYAGDLLSRAMSHVKENNLWITIMSNANVIAVASLTGCAAVLLAEGVELIPEALAAAEDNDILVLSSPKSVYELCVLVGSTERAS